MNIFHFNGFNLLTFMNHVFIRWVNICSLYNHHIKMLEQAIFN